MAHWVFFFRSGRCAASHTLSKLRTLMPSKSFDSDSPFCTFGAPLNTKIFYVLVGLYLGEMYVDNRGAVSGRGDFTNYALYLCGRNWMEALKHRI